MAWNVAIYLVCQFPHFLICVRCERGGRVAVELLQNLNVAFRFPDLHHEGVLLFPLTT